MQRSVSPSSVAGTIRAPASKSSMQRALACAALASGRSRLGNPSFSADCLAALSLVEALGARIERRADAVLVEGRPPGETVSPGAGTPTEGPRRLSCGESGLCIRMFAPITALYSGDTLLEAEGSLRSRPLGMTEGVLESLGGSCLSAMGFPPLRVTGPLRGGRARADGSSSSQFITGLLVALPLAVGDSILEVERLASAGYVDMTLDTMRAFGVEIEASRPVALGPANPVFRIPGGQRYRACDFEIEGDWSGGAFLLVAAALAARAGGLALLGLSPRSSQPDRAVMRALASAGAAIVESPDRIVLGRGELRAFAFDARDCPDLFPPLVALASACRGESRIAGVSRLRGKESDRAAALSEGFSALGAAVRVEGDELV
ncbi:MAG TPA: hypothetical protein VMC79_08175, partial [Rectinemataceae bacterium]|nr:hypothetical protein [Rectinemataceae bacterium]